MKLDNSSLKESLLLYAVTDRSWTGEKTIFQQVEETLKGGTTFLQLREKNLSDEEFKSEAEEIKKICAEYKVPFVINDNVELAKEIDADGVHVGQDDMNACNVRQIIGNDKILGVSVQTVEQAILAEKQGADYLGVGAVFPTNSKSDAVEVPYDTLKAICTSVKIPVVAIGGIMIIFGIAVGEVATALSRQGIGPKKVKQIRSMFIILFAAIAGIMGVLTLGMVLIGNAYKDNTANLIITFIGLVAGTLLLLTTSMNMMEAVISGISISLGAISSNDKIKKIVVILGMTFIGIATILTIMAAGMAVIGSLMGGYTWEALIPAIGMAGGAIVAFVFIA